MLTVACWRWRPREGYRSSYPPETVHTLQRMVARHYPAPHRFLCITDDPAGLEGVETLPLWDDYADLPHPSNPMQPSCYRRLKAFDPTLRHVLGPRLVSLDLDCVILDDLRPLWDRPEDFVGWAGTTKPVTAFNGSMWLLTPGKRSKVWTDFNPAYSPGLAKRAGFYGSDQAWLSYVLGTGEARWSTRDGVFSYRLHVAPQRGRLPDNARIVFFNGKCDPWSPEVGGLDWIRAHYR
jgi:hypothetical protein